MNYSEFYSHEDHLASATSTTTWGPLWATGDTHPLVPQSTHPDLVYDPGYLCTAGSYPDLNAADDAAFSFAPTTEMGAFPAVPLNDLDTWLMPTPSSIDLSPAVAQPQSVGNPYWTGVTPPAAYSAAATPDSGVSPTSTTPTSQDIWAWISNFLPTPYMTPASSPGDGGEAGWGALEHGANLFGAETSPAGRDASEFAWPIPAASNHVASNATMTYTPTTALGKRCREADEPRSDEGPVGINTNTIPPQKRARGGTSGILNAKRSMARTRHNLVARIPVTRINGKPEEAGRGAERLATPNAHGIYHQSLPGPSLQQGWAVEPADGQPTWVEGSVDEETAHHTVQQQQEEATTELFEIPRIFKRRYKLLLQASEVDFARGAVQTIKCRLCPETKLKDFEEFKRHCKTVETHPLQIHFCDDCGDYFARSDSLKRHHNQPPAECRKVTPAKAAEKRRVTKEEYDNFIWRLDHGLITGEENERSFSQIIKEKYPESSKKRTGGSK